MRRTILFLLLGGICAAWSAWPALAQPTSENLSLQRRAAEFERLYLRRAEPLEPEEKIELAEKALQLEPGLDPWPFRDPREFMKGELYFHLGYAYYVRRQGARAENLELAINAYESAVSLYSRDRYALEWARTQTALGSLYRVRILGDRAHILEQSIAAFEAALTFFTDKEYPVDWGTVQNNLGSAYAARIRGDRAENLEKAIKAFNEALTVRFREAFPHHWARTKASLGSVYRFRIRGDRMSNLEQAIFATEAALTIFTEKEFPQEWGALQSNLGSIHLIRLAGDKAENQERAMEFYDRALRARTRENFPEDWAETQISIGLLHSERIRGDRAENLERAIAAYRAGLSIFSPLDAWPLDQLHASRWLGQALLEKGDWRAAAAAFASAREAFLLLFGQGLDEVEARELITRAGPLFAEAAYAAAEMGDRKAALSLMNEGKARLLAVALRQQSLELPPAERTRHAAIKAQIREVSRIAESAAGIERSAALARLAALRNALRELVKSVPDKDTPDDAIAAAGSLVSDGGAIIVPIITKSGGKILIITAAIGGPASVTAIDLPELTSTRVNRVVFGDVPGVIGGWRGDYAKTEQMAELAGKIGKLAVFSLFAPELAAELRQKRAEFDRLDREWRGAIEAIGELGRFFAGTLETSLADLGVKPGARLIWLPAGPLGLLPLGLARASAGKPALAEHYEIVYAPNLHILKAARARVATQVAASAVVIANPTNDLKYAEMEAEVVARHFPPDARTILDRSNGTRTAVLSELGRKTYWHFSTHGKFSWDDVRESALLLRDQRLTLGELIETYDINGPARPRLVTLSACETGLYDIYNNPEEFVGFPGVFMLLGAAGVLSTLWPVDDRATMLLMTKFYDLHRNGGLAPPAALKGAQDWLRKTPSDGLLAYAKTALDANRFAALERGFQSDGTQVRYGVVISSPQATRPPTLPGPPFAHPFYWAAFVYEGL